MTVAVAALDSTIAQLVERRAEPGWLRDLRAEWWRRAESTPWPTGQEEEWRRTKLAGLPRDGALLETPPIAEHRLDVSLAKRGVIFSDLGAAVRDHGELLAGLLGRNETLPAQAHFWARSLAAWTTGTFLYVPDGVTVDEPLVASSALPDGAWSHFPHSLVVLGRDAEATLLEEVTSPDGSPAWHGATTEIRVGEGARLRYASLQRLGDATWRLGATRADVAKDGQLTLLDAEVGARVAKVGLDARMVGSGGTSRLLGILAAGGQQQIDINSTQDLLGSHTTSDLLYLSALYDEARAAFYGVTRVRPQAKGTSSYQECRNLLLSPKAGAEPIPVLEIETNDILRCGHGATAGAIDPVQRFYAMTRGLSSDEAERMIVRGFFERVVAQIGSEPIRARVLAALATRIGSDPGLEVAA